MPREKVTPKTLRALLDGLAGCQVQGDVDVPVTGVAYHSREVTPGGLFVALKAAAPTATSIWPPASSRGARVVVTEQELAPPAGGHGGPGAPGPPGPGPLSAAFYGHPSRELTLVGITGTNGKTSTTYILEAILSAAGCRVGVVGTVNYRVGESTWPAPVTTPESLDLQRLLREMRTRGVTHVFLEVSLPCPGFKAGGRRGSSPPRSSPTCPKTTWTTTGTWTIILPPSPGSFWNSWPTAAPPRGWRSSTWTTPGGMNCKTPVRVPALTYGLPSGQPGAAPELPLPPGRP